VLLADQLSKAWVLQHPQPRPLLPGLLGLRLVHNDGAAFSLFDQGAHWLGWISLLVSLGLLVAIIGFRSGWGPWQRQAAGWLLGGTLGNGLDRWRLGSVTDFLELLPISFPVFNLADVAINVAVVCLLMHAWRERR
jgi:signal peptidase II